MGRSVCITLPLPGGGLSRFALDHALWRAAIAVGVLCRHADPVTRVTRLWARRTESDAPAGFSLGEAFGAATFVLRYCVL